MARGGGGGGGGVTDRRVNQVAFNLVAPALIIIMSSLSIRFQALSSASHGDEGVHFLLPKGRRFDESASGVKPLIIQHFHVSKICVLLMFIESMA